MIQLTYKKKILFLLLFCIFFSIKIFGQKDRFVPPDSLKKTVVRLNIIRPGITVEQGINLTNTLVADISIYIPHFYDSTQFKYYFFFYPSFKGEYRHYYNFSKRLREGKSINRYSGSYIGILYQHLFGDKTEPTFDQAGVMWGTQYVSLKKFHIGFNIGFGYVIYEDPRLAPKFTLIGDLKLGYTF